MNFELRDGRDMTVWVPRPGGDQLVSLRTGWISDARGNVTTLRREDFAVTPRRLWRRDATCAYPVEWDVTIKGLRLHVRPALDSTELRTIGSPLSPLLWPEFPAIWDGPTMVDGAATGRGWMDIGHPCWL
jgi:predicted secreted hydrolase